jgi:hypothetical protein
MVSFYFIIRQNINVTKVRTYVKFSNSFNKEHKQLYVKMKQISYLLLYKKF